jgi:GNAT superfamily N-acetyltransferase
VVAIDLRGAVAEDLEAMCALHNRSEAHDGVPRVLELDEMREELDDERVMLATDVRVALCGGQMAGYTYTYHLPSAERLERCHVLGQVDPDHRGRGVGRALLGWGIERATTQLRSSGNGLPKVIRVNNFDYIASAHRLYRRMGFDPVRYFDELLRPLDDLPALDTTTGVTIAPWPTTGVRFRSRPTAGTTRSAGTARALISASSRSTTPAARS